MFPCWVVFLLILHRNAECEPLQKPQRCWNLQDFSPIETSPVGSPAGLFNEFCVSCLILIESVWTKGSKWRSGLAGLKRSISRH